MVDRTELRNALAELAVTQSGYFTAAQARELGYDYPQHTFHTARGNWERVGRGLYRLPFWPIEAHDDLVRASLLARHRGVVSHESAAAFHELAEIDPLLVHLTVPRAFRSAVPGTVLHRLGSPPAGQVEDHGGFRVTTPVRTLVDLGRSGVDLDHLGRAIHDAVERHLVTRRELRVQARAIDAEAALSIEYALAEEG